MLKSEEAGLREALTKVDNLIAASLGEQSSCAVFESHHGDFTEEQKRSVRVYVETWIQTPLRAVLDSVDGNRSYANQEYLGALRRSR